MIKRLLKITLAYLLFMQAALVAATPMYVTVQGKIAFSSQGLITAKKEIEVSIVDTHDPDCSDSAAGTCWSDTLDVNFVEGAFSFVIGTNRALTADYFDLTSPNFQILVPSLASSPVRFPIPSTPYAIQSKIAEEALSVDASTITGTFIVTLNVTNDFIVNNDDLVVDSSTGFVGVGTTAPGYALDVEGTVNADNFLINGQSLDSIFSWSKSGTRLYYNEGNVGIGTNAPGYALDVVGTVNATNILINGSSIATTLKTDTLFWSDGDDNNIYFGASNDGNVGIGTSSPNVKLDVKGGIRISALNQGNTAAAGTIQFVNGNDPDFIGYDGEEWISLTGLSGNGESGQVAVWVDDDELTGSSDLVWDNTNRLLGVGLGANDPTARLDIIAPTQSSLAIMNIQNNVGNSIFYVGQDSVGIGTTTPGSEYILDVNGNINVQDITINGGPINEHVSQDTFWKKEDKNLYYQDGYVGIGTDSPNSPLELSDSTGNVAITFDFQGTDYFTMGIDGDNPETFVISEGSDLSAPIFAFDQDLIGIGTVRPSANLHVSGNSGLIVTGVFGNTDDLFDPGTGSKMFFFPGLAAFRAGYATLDEFDVDNIGDYSVALGSKSRASGEGSSVLGGDLNEASGDFSTVAGGQYNEAAGRYSFAAGLSAKALHSGTFVWSDTTSSENYFASSVQNQFLIRSHGGVGINTNDTSEAVLNVAVQDNKNYIFRGLDADGNTQMIVNASGNVGIGTTRLGDNVKMAIMNGLVGVGVTNPAANFHIVADGSSNIIFAIFPENSPTAAILVTNSGNVGIGVTAGYDFDSDESEAIFVVNGPIAGESFVIDGENPVTLTPSNGSPWSTPNALYGNSIYYNLGNVGIGTATPNSLLELSNQNVSGNEPLITFDLDDEDIFTLGVTLNNQASDYLFLISPGSKNSRTAPISISTSSVGIGTHLAVPTGTLQVSGNTIINGKLAIGTESLNSAHQVNVAGILNTSELYLNNTLFVPAESPWETNLPHIYYTAGRVGIGTSAPSVELEVEGQVSTNYFTLSSDIDLNGTLQTTQLELEDQNYPDRFGVVFVDNGKLYYTNPSTNVTQSLDESLNIGEGDTGKLAYFAGENTIGESDISWNNTDPILTVSGNLTVTRRYSITDYEATSLVSIGGSSLIVITANLSHNDESTIENFTAQSIDIDIQDKWGRVNNGDPGSDEVVVKGLDIAMRNTNNSYFLNGARAVGLQVDMTNVAVSEAEGGTAAAAVFLGGNVGIGLSNPTAELEVLGTVSANYFNITDGLIVPDITVNGDAFVARSKEISAIKVPRVGIGITDPENYDANLIVDGLISANNVIISNGLQATTVNIGDASTTFFYIDSTGNIGLGTHQPSGQFTISKALNNGNSGEDFISQKIDISLDGAKDDVSEFRFNRDLVGIDVNFSSASNFDTLDSPATGINVDLTDLVLTDESTAYGLYVDVSGDTGTRYAATFLGGRVGIGVTQPSADLHVSGDIKANNLILEGAISSDEAIFNYLTVHNTATFNGTLTVNSLVVSNTLTAATLVVDEALETSEATITTINASVITANLLSVVTLNVDSSISGASAYFSQGVGVGTTPSIGLIISGDLKSRSIVADSDLTLVNGTMNINSGTLFINNASPYVGISTVTPVAPLHVRTPASSRAFIDSDISTWQGVRLQSRSDLLNTASGIALVPDSGTPSDNVGSGIVALRASALEGGSHLAFVTDPIEGLPSERMRITSEGLLGIGTTQPNYDLQVNGDFYVDGSVTVNGILSAAILTGPNGITINPNGILSVSGTASFNSDIVIGNTLYFEQGTAPDDTINYGRVYVDENDGDLYYLKPNGSIPLNLSSAFTGEATRIPYFDDNGNLSSEAPLFYDDSRSRFTVGTSNILTTVYSGVSVNNSFIGDLSAQKIILEIDDRSGILPAPTDPSTFVGLDVHFSPLSSVGRLYNGETAVGLKVDMSDIRAVNRSFGVSNLGYKYSALFLGGNVGVGTETPEAALQVINTSSETPPFRVDTTSTANVLVVDTSGYVGVGNSEPSSRLHITGVGTSSSSSPLLVENSSNTPLLYVNDAGNVGIGTTTPTTKLEVIGVISANIGSFVELHTTTINIGNGNFYVDISGNIGIGTETPSSSIALYKHFTTAPNTDFTSEKIRLILGEDQEAGLQYFKHNATGLDILLNTGTNSLFGNDNIADGVNTITGVSINMSELVLENDASLTGLYVDVSGDTGTRYAGIFTGGNVGIGTTQPEYALHVSGDIKANGLILSGTFSASEVTYNNLVVEGTATFNDTLTIDNLVADSISVTNISLTGTLVVATGSFTTINATAYGVFDQVGIGGGLPTHTLDVNGTTVITGSVTITDLLSVSTVNAGANPLVLTSNTFVKAMASVSVNGDILLDNALHFTPVSQPASLSGYGQLYTSSNGHLAYINPIGTPIKLTEALIGSPNRVPFYDSTGSLNDSAPLTWDATNSRFTVGGTDTLTRILVSSNVGTTFYENEHIGQHINLEIGNRRTISRFNDYTGLKIEFTGVDLDNDNAFGRLGENETAIGLLVDLTNLPARWSGTEPVDEDSDRTGIKHAAIFNGGSVGIGYTEPEATLHIKPERDGNTLLIVDSYSTENVLVVEDNGRVGVGITGGAGLLSVKGLTSSGGAAALSVTNSSSDPLFHVKNDGKIGISTANPEATLHVVGTTPFIVDTTTVENAMYVTTDGYLGLGTNTPSSNVHIISPANQDAFRVGIDGIDDYAFVVSRNGNVGIGISQPEFKLHTDGIILSGTDNISTSLIRLPTWLTSESTEARGFFSHFGTANSFFGLREDDIDPTILNPTLYWGEDNSNLIFQHGNTTSTTEIMRITYDGEVGIGTRVPSASLHVVGANPFRVDTAGVEKVINVSASGKVGVLTDVPSADFHVVGEFTANTIEITDGDVEVSTLNVTDYLSVVRNVNTDTTATAQAIVLNLNNNLTSDIVGLDIKLTPALNPTFESPVYYTLYNDATAYGLKVDLSDIVLDHPTLSDGRAVAAAFTGGFVGVGTTAPNYPLHVSSETDKIARFGGSDSSLLIEDYGDFTGENYGAVNFLVSKGPNEASYSGLTLKTGVTGSDTAIVGVGFSQDDIDLLDSSDGILGVDVHLVVNGDMRLGLPYNAASAETLGTAGNKLYFSGGPDVSSTFDSENGDSIWMGRYNLNTSGASGLYAVVGDDGTSDDAFSVGWASDGTLSQFNHVLTARMDGHVGIGTSQPSTNLHIVGDLDEDADTEDHLVLIENQGSSDADSLGIYHNLSSSQINSSSHFVTFMSSDSVLGMITGNDDSGQGVRYVSQGADYAEYLKKMDTETSFEAGDIVGVYFGEISKNTEGAGQVMVKSSGASVAGNFPGEENKSLYELIAFFGQVPIKIRGPVKKGDFIVPSGQHDGTGIAVSSENINAYPANLIVGRAWEESDEAGVKLIHSAIGFNFNLPSYESSFQTVTDLHSKVRDLQIEQQQLIDSLEAVLDKQSKEIQSLLDHIQSKSN